MSYRITDFDFRVLLSNNDCQRWLLDVESTAVTRGIVHTTTMPPSTRSKLNVIRRNNTRAARLRWTRLSIVESLTRRSRNVNNYYFITIVRSRVFIESRQKCTQSPRAFSIAHFCCFKVTAFYPALHIHKRHTYSIYTFVRLRVHFKLI